ncbi:MAG TPA: ATP-binding protein [Solimonas sp.]|nr:ATP-binding protein [Solimonas sp.]
MNLPGKSLGKYREIVIAVALFLLFDLGVLVLNFYTSFKIDQDTVAINLAGRQRYTSQRIARTLLELDAARVSGQPYKPETLKELRSGSKTFEISHQAFREGATVPGGDGKPVFLAAVTSPRGRELEEKVESLWRPYHQALQPLQNDGFSQEQLSVALAYSQANNIALLGVANDFVTETQHIGASRARTLRLVQTGGILLALLNFAFILMKFLRRLNDYDRKVEAAQRETAEILGTVKEGLFLLDHQFRIGLQYSASLSQILGRDIAPGDDFRAVLRAMLPAGLLEPSCDYLELLLGDRVKESLVATLNPLTSVEVSVGHARRYLTMSFNRVVVDGRISHLLVTVSDVTAQVELERALADSRKRAQVEVDAMFNLLRVEPAALRQFLDNAERALLDINDRLRAVKAQHDYRSSISAIFRKVHTLKGEAATLGLDMFEDLAQRFEELLAGLRAKGSVAGEDLLALPLPLDEFLQRIALVRELTRKLAHYHDAFTPVADTGFEQQLGALAERIAKDHGKQVRVVTELGPLGSLPQQVSGELRDIAVQLLRNAVVHGIEAVTERSSRAKPEAGTIYLGLKPVGEGEYEFVLRDDGRGLVPQRLREVLLQTGRCSAAELEQLDDRQIVMKIFDSGFSTAGEVTRDAGHGVGLDVVRQKIRQLGAQLRIRSSADVYTQFSIRFAA